MDVSLGRDRLDTDIWTPSYMPAWSSRAQAAATCTVQDGVLRLSVPPEQQLWCPDLHDGPLKVSAVQSGNWSGPLGGTRGQQPFRDGLVVREEQPTVRGFLPHLGRIEVDCRATITPRSMFSAWMVGFEDEPDRCGEICIMEVFGDAVGTTASGEPAVAVGSGVHPFRDPALQEEFSTLPMAIDVARSHTYAVQWREDGIDWFVDGDLVRRSDQSPGYPMQLVLGVFDFPAKATPAQVSGADATPTPELVVTRVAHHPV
jgi:hypothetical protein